jgi:release factor glutamine methyltransferase
MVDRAVKAHMPARALRGGAEGLEVIRPLIAGAAHLLRPGGLLAVEIADAHQEAVLTLAREAAGLVNVRTHRDHDGFWRFLTVERDDDPAL